MIARRVKAFGKDRPAPQLGRVVRDVSIRREASVPACHLGRRLARCDDMLDTGDSVARKSAGDRLSVPTQIASGHPLVDAAEAVGVA